MSAADHNIYISQVSNLSSPSKVPFEGIGFNPNLMMESILASASNDKDDYVTLRNNKNELSSAQKTPISLLQELCARCNKTPDYKLLSVEGAVHAPTFIFRVQVGEVVSTASGQSKKKAKHAAAKTLLEKLIGENGMFAEKAKLPNGEPLDMDFLNTLNSEAVPDSTSSDDGLPGNPVGLLQEYCMKNRWRPPFYETKMTDGLPHERVFGIVCYVNEYQEIGRGKSKRIAKREASSKMLQYLENLNDDTEKLSTSLDGISFKDNEKFDGIRLKASGKISSSNAAHRRQVSDFFEALRDKESASLKMLHKEDLSAPANSFLDLLQDIADENDFDVIYVPLLQKSHSGKYQCLVQLSCPSIAVCFGTGEDAAAAKFDAAHNALQYLKIVTRK